MHVRDKAGFCLQFRWAEQGFGALLATACFLVELYVERAKNITLLR